MREFIAQEPMLAAWLGLMLVGGLIGGIVTGFFRARKIQPNGFRWKQLAFEGVVAVVTLMIAGPALGWIISQLWASGIIEVSRTPATWWIIALEYVAYFLLFDTYFYWLHRWMHNEPVYRLVHKLHHRSTSPNLLTTLSVNPLESIINGGFVAIFTSLLTIHNETMALILPTNIVMGLYVHSGYEFFPRWWNRSWATKWFITASFHDHHHKYFTGNFGGYTTIWDRLCGTIRPKWEGDYLKIKDRQRTGPVEAEPAAQPAG